MKRPEYMTSQKKSLLDFLRRNKDRHFSIDEIISALCSEGLPPSKSTVYRLIKKQVEEGAVRRFEAPGAKSFVYQFAEAGDGCDEHFHLKCVDCGRLLHMECEFLDKAREHILAEHGFLIGSEQSVIYGQCALCAEKDAEKNHSEE